MEPQIQEYRPWLMFKIDEGGRQDFIVRNIQHEDEIEKYISNIYSFISDFGIKYRPSVLINPIQMYRRDYWRKEHGTPIDRIHDTLRYVFDYFETRADSEEKKVSFFLEVYSSDNACEQNGELDYLEPASIYGYGAGKTGLGIDLKTIAAIKEHYPKSFAGIRFHEIYGSDLVQKLTNDHAFILEPEVVEACINTCAEKDLILYWTDSSWLMNTLEGGARRYVADTNYKPYFKAEPYRSLQEKAVEYLGKKVIFSYANNNYSIPNNLERLNAKVAESAEDIIYPISAERNPYHFVTEAGMRSQPLDASFYFDLPYEHHPLKDIDGAGWGISCQAWFWSELLYSMCGKKYYSFGNDDCPVELMASYTLKAIGQRADAIQYEPVWYLFNSGCHHMESEDGFEGQRDYTPRTNFKRLKQILLDTECAGRPDSEPNNYFDDNMQRLVENNYTNPPKVYAQCMLGLLSHSTDMEKKKRSKLTSFDFYSNGTAWIQEQPFRIPEAIINGAEYIHRISLMGNGEDAVIVVKDQGNGRKSLSIYRQNGNFVCRNDEILNEANSEFVAVVAANLVAEVNGDGDPDELIVIRKLKSNGNLIPDVYKLNFPVRGSLKADFISLSGDGIQIISFLESCLNKKGFRFCGMTGIRRNTFLHKDKRRDLDSMAFIREDEEEGTILAGICNFENHNQLIFRENYIKCKLSEQFFVTSMDIDMDRQEEIITARTEGDKVGLGIYKLKGCALELQHIKWLKNGIKSGTPVCLTSISRYIPVNIF